MDGAIVDMLLASASLSIVRGSQLSRWIVAAGQGHGTRKESLTPVSLDRNDRLGFLICMSETSVPSV